MNHRFRAPVANGIKSQEIVIRMKDGRSYRICSPGQMQTILMKARERVLNTAAANLEELGEEQIDERAIRLAENSGFATMEMVMKMMTPEEQKLWRDSYRFGGVGHSRKGD